MGYTNTNMSSQSLPFLDAVNLRIADTKIEISISGHWPTPSWAHLKTDIDIKPEQKKIEVRYIGKSKGGIAIQVLESFSDSIEVEKPESGKWEVLVFGKSGQISKEIEIS